MTGITFDVELEDRAVRGALDELARRGRSLRPAMAEIGSYMVTSTLDRFERETDPQGRPWRPLAPATVRRRRRGRSGGVLKILQDKGRLRQSITYEASDDQVLIGTNVIYSAIHQLGGQAGRGLKTNIPARPYLGVDDRDQAAIGEILADYVEGAWN